MEKRLWHYVFERDLYIPIFIFRSLVPLKDLWYNRNNLNTERIDIAGKAGVHESKGN